MDVPPALLQFIGSLAAILALTGLAWWLKLGPAHRLASVESARTAADQAVSGFEPASISLDLEGRGAIMCDAKGRILLLRPHGVHFAGRILTGRAQAREEDGTLIIDTAERRFGAARLQVDEAAAWVQAIEALEC